MKEAIGIKNCCLYSYNGGYLDTRVLSLLSAMREKSMGQTYYRRQTRLRLRKKSLTGSDSKHFFLQNNVRSRRIFGNYCVVSNNEHRFIYAR